MRKSNLAIKASLKGKNIKAVKDALGISQALIYKWMADPAVRNPLDRVLKLIELSGNLSIIRWLCNACGGFLVMNPNTSNIDISDGNLTTIIKRSNKTTELIAEITNSEDQDLLEELRNNWEKQKSIVESFIYKKEALSQKITRANNPL